MSHELLDASALSAVYDPKVQHVYLWATGDWRARSIDFKLVEDQGFTYRLEGFNGGEPQTHPGRVYAQKEQVIVVEGGSLKEVTIITAKHPDGQKVKVVTVPVFQLG